MLKRLRHREMEYDNMILPCYQDVDPPHAPPPLVPPPPLPADVSMPTSSGGSEPERLKVLSRDDRRLRKQVGGAVVKESMPASDREIDQFLRSRNEAVGFGQQ